LEPLPVKARIGPGKGPLPGSLSPGLPDEKDLKNSRIPAEEVIPETGYK
jgi:hypothetical protein